MIALATRFREGVEAVLLKYDVPWSIAQLGARAEYRFTRPAPRNGTESAAAHDDDIEEYLHLYLSNRGVLITPFHNMALMCPDTTAGRRGPAQPVVRGGRGAGGVRPRRVAQVTRLAGCATDRYCPLSTKRRSRSIPSHTSA